MKSIIDPVFGDLEWEECWIRDETLDVLGVEFDVLLLVNPDDDGSIWDEQRAAFQKFEVEKPEIIERALDALFDFYQKNRSSFLKRLETNAETILPHCNSPKNLLAIVDFAAIVFPVIWEPGDEFFGFTGEAPWHEERGFGIMFRNGKIAVGTDSIVIG